MADYTLSTDYTRFSYQDFLTDFYARLKNDERFAKIGSAAIYGMFMEMIAASTDSTNYFIQRTAEESYIDTCRLLSSGIKIGHNLGYNPVRATPARADVHIMLKGPLPSTLKAGATLYFSQEETKLSINGHKFILSTDYSYTFDENDIAEGVGNSSWTKTLIYSKDQADMHYRKIQGIKYWQSSDVKPISIIQGEFKTTQYDGFSNVKKVGRNYQSYVLDDLKFSNWYAQRDPNAYYRDTYTPRFGFTKVGIGPNPSIAFADNNIYTIEEDSVYLNADVINADTSDDDFEPKKVCRMYTNPDKTISFSFGDGKIVSNGLNNTKDSIFVQYFITDGGDANAPGAEGALLSFDNKFYATQENGVIDVSGNVQFTITGDIYGGADFETLDSIKINAPMHYASNKKLITMKDFVSYFKTLTDPIKVKYAIAWGQDQIEKLDEAGRKTYKRLQNNVLYCITGNTYNINGKVNKCINVLNDEYENGAFTLYGNGTDYIKHLCDYTKIVYSWDLINEQQYADRPATAWQQNVNKIRNNIESRLMLNTNIYSMPPIIHYYDLVGEVEVKSLSKLQQYKTNVENEIYEWLDSTNNFAKKIYKSDFVKFFMNYPETNGVDLDIRVSELEKADTFEMVFDVAKYDISKMFILNQNIPNSRSETISKNKSAYWNVIYVPKKDKYNISTTVGALKDKQLEIIYRFKVKSTNAYRYGRINSMPYQVSETSDYIVLGFYGAFNFTDYENGKTYKNTEIEFDTRCYMTIALPNAADFVSTSNFSENNTESYGLSKTEITDVKNKIQQWMLGTPEVTTADRAIDLPYFVSAFDVNAREETILRRGIMLNSSDLSMELSEHAFWNYMVPIILQKYIKSDTDMSSSDIQTTLWDHVENLIYDVYALLKPVLSDSILDDNNNITNYSMDNELSVIRINVKYKYKA